MYEYDSSYCVLPSREHLIFQPNWKSLLELKFHEFCSNLLISLAGWFSHQCMPFCRKLYTISKPSLPKRVLFGCRGGFNLQKRIHGKLQSICRNLNIILLKTHSKYIINIFSTMFAYNHVEITFD